MLEPWCQSGAANATTTRPTAWWVNDPELVEVRSRTAEEFGIDLDAAESIDAIDDGADELASTRSARVSRADRSRPR